MHDSTRVLKILQGMIASYVVGLSSGAAHDQNAHSSRCQVARGQQPLPLSVLLKEAHGGHRGGGGRMQNDARTVT